MQNHIPLNSIAPERVADRGKTAATDPSEDLSFGKKTEITEYILRLRGQP